MFLVIDLEGLIISLFTGFSFLLGSLINSFLKDKKNINVLAISLGFVVILNLIVMDILPEVVENIDFWKIAIIFLGVFILKIIDLFVPHHTHNHKEKRDDVKEHKGHLKHISIVTVLALLLHNVIECMALYNLTLESLKAGIFMGIGVSLHNIPLGFQVASSLEKEKNMYIAILSLSGFCGGLISFLMGPVSTNIEIYILCFTLGMLVYLLFFEFLKELWQSRKNKYALFGILIGIAFILVSSLI